MAIGIIKGLEFGVYLFSSSPKGLLTLSNHESSAELDPFRAMNRPT